MVILVASLETVSLYYYLDHQPANRQHKINGFGTAAHTVSNVKVTNDMRQTITLPWNSVIDKCNVAIIKNKVYDVTDVRAGTLASNKSMELDLLYNPVSTIMKTGDTIYGIWERTPSMQHRAFKVNIADDTLKTSRTIALAKIADYGSESWPIFYYQITAKYDISTKDSSQLVLYGGIAPWLPYFVSNPAPTAMKINTGTSAVYVPLESVINDIDTKCLIPSDSVVDVAISRRCPWRTGISGSVYAMKTDATTEATPIYTGANIGIIKINASGIDDNLDITTSGTITLTDFERYCGRVVVCDELDNEICEIPTEYFDANNQLTYYCGARADYGGIYTHFKFSDKTIIWPEGHLPWIGDSWVDYQTRTLQYDREMLANGIKDLNAQYELDKQTALANGVMNVTYAGAMGGMSGNPVAAGMGAGMALASTAIQTMAMDKKVQIDRRSMYAQQTIKEGLIKRAPSNNYQTGYGLDYMHRSYANGGAKIKIQTPTNLTSTDYTNYISYRGYPCGKYASFTLTTGFLKGNMFSTPNDTYMPRGNGPELDALRREIALGVRLV